MREDQIDENRSLRPHSVPNMQTPIGRFIDRLGYGSLLLCAAATLILASVYYTFAPDDHGIEAHHFGDALYFSIVSFTSLGYGDIAPQGFGRFVAALVVVIGLAVFALIIGKVASERQSALLTLLHTSDVQRRLSNFTQQLHEATDEISQAEPSRARKLKSTRDLLHAISSYVSFNAFQAGAVNFGNFTGLGMLYDALNGTFKTCITAFSEGSDPETMRRALACARAIERLVNLMSRLHRENQRRDSSSKKKAGYSRRARSQTAAAEKAHKLRADMAATIKSSLEWQDKAFHALQVERVFEAMPSGSHWPTGIHKRIAAELRISNSTASRCITQLKNNGRLPKS